MNTMMAKEKKKQTENKSKNEIEMNDKENEMQ